MVWLAIVVGAVIGLLVGHEAEFGLVGAVLGWLVARSNAQQGEIATLRTALQQRAAAGAAVAPSAPVAATEAKAVAAEPAAAAPVEATAEVPPRAEAPSLPAGAPARAASTTPIAGPLAALKRWLFGGNTIVKAGVGILFVGLAFLAKYASEHVQVAVEWRLAGIAVVAIVLLGVGWRLRASRPGYAQVLQGGAVAVLYLVLFAAFRFYGVIAAGPAFALMALVAAFAAALAVLQDARALAVVGALGGFATPLLVSTGGGNFVALFSYYLVLDLGIAAVAWHRAWRSLNLIGFFATFVVATAWGVLRYRPDDYAASQAFLVAFFVLFIAIWLLPSRRPSADDDEARPAHRGDGWVDGTLLFGLPTIAFVLQWGLVRQWPYAVALSALLLAAFYVALAAWMRGRPRFALAFEAGIGVAVVFLTLVFPFALDARATAGAWALEGAGLVWIGLRQARGLPRAAGYALLLLAGVALGHDSPRLPASFVNGEAIGALMIAAGALFAALHVQRRLPAGVRFEALAEPLLIAWALWWLLWFAQRQIGAFVEPGYRLTAWVGAVSLLAALFGAIAVRFAWPKAAWPALLHLPALALFMLFLALDGTAPFSAWGAIAWALALVVHLALLRRAATHWPTRATTLVHALGAVVLAGIGALQCRSWSAALGDAGSAWRWLGWGVFPALLLLALLHVRALATWPVSAQPPAYRRLAGGVLAAGLLLWTLLANWHSSGSAAPLPHVPLLNPLDLGVGIALIAAARWVADAALPGRWPQLLLGASAFVWLNAMLIRAFHHYADVPYRLHAWADSLPVQTGLTLLWSATALLLMWRSARAGQRALWIAGAALLAAVVLKLLLVDLSGTGTVTRIVSFIGVGALMLVIGYVAPLPAARRGDASTEAVHAPR